MLRELFIHSNKMIQFGVSHFSAVDSWDVIQQIPVTMDRIGGQVTGLSVIWRDAPPYPEEPVEVIWRL